MAIVKWNGVYLNQLQNQVLDQLDVMVLEDLMVSLAYPVINAVGD